jgi:hypothetical protein
MSSVYFGFNGSLEGFEGFKGLIGGFYPGIVSLGACD